MKIKKPVSIIILLFWIFMMGLLARQHLFVPALTGDSSGMPEFVSVRERQEWAGLYFDEKKIGYVSSEIIPVQEGYIIKESLFMDMAMMGMGQKLESSLHTITDRNLRLSLFNFRMKTGDSTFTAYGNVENGKTINLTTIQGNQTQRKKIQTTGAPMLTSSLKLYTLQKGLKPGTSFQQGFFDPMTMTDRQIQVDILKKEDIHIHGVKQSAYKIRQSYLGIEVFSWMTEDGITLKEQSSMGIVLIKEDKDTAMKDNWAEPVDIVSAVAVTPDRQIPAEQITGLNLRLKNISFDGLDIHGDRQRRHNDFLEITRETLDDSTTYPLPFSGEGFEHYLIPSLFIQSDAPEIQAAAKRIIGSLTDAADAVEALNTWVYQSIDKTPSMSVPGALEVLHTRRGDCNEHSVLLTALLRAAGIPARLCAGLAYLEDRFYYHAWVEVYLNKWVSIDPTFGEFPAPVTNIRLIHGDFESMVKILNIVGRIQIQVLDAS